MDSRVSQGAGANEVAYFLWLALPIPGGVTTCTGLWVRQAIPDIVHVVTPLSCDLERVISLFL